MQYPGCAKTFSYGKLSTPFKDIAATNAIPWYIQGIALVAAGKEFVEHEHFPLCSEAVIVCTFLNVDRRDQETSWFLYHDSCTAKRGRRRYTYVTFKGDVQVPRLFAMSSDLYSCFHICKHMTSVDKLSCYCAAISLCCSSNRHWCNVGAPIKF